MGKTTRARRGGFAVQDLEIIAKFSGGLVTETQIFFQGAANDAFEIGRHVGIYFAGRPGIAIQDGVEEQSGAFGAKGQRSSGHFVQNNAEGEEVSTSVQFFGAYLLR